MSVASKNSFAILEEDGSRPSTPPQAAPDPTSNTATKGNQRGRGRSGPASRGGKYPSRGGPRTPGPRDGQAADDDADDGAEKKKFDGGEGRGRGRGRGRGGFRGEGRGEGRGGGRRGYDRHSATGKTDSDKKLHQTWGGDEGITELQTEQAAAKDAAVEQTGAIVEDNSWGPTASADDVWGAPPADDAWGVAPAAEDAWGPPPATDTAPTEGDRNEGRRGREREPEEPDNTLTLDQYMAQQKEKALAVPKLETRKVNEGVDESLWKGAIEMQKKDEEEDAYFVGKTKNVPKHRTEKKEKVFLEIDARYERPTRGGGRGGRGGERGGDRGGDRGGRGRGRGFDRERRGRSNGSTQLNVDDEKAFPSLS